MNAPSRLSANRLKPDNAPIRVMLVDDSVVTRTIFRRILETNAQIAVVCEAESSEKALISLRNSQVDIILLDIEMPNQSGLDALPELVKAAQGARILVLSAFVDENGPATVKALSLGACDTLSKPGVSGFSGRFSELLLEKVIRLGGPEISSALLDENHINHQKVGEPHCIAIGASTGGIPAIFELISNLDIAIKCPIFIAQHLPQAFMVYFARQLADHTARNIVIAKAGMDVRDDHIYIAQGNSHLVCKRDAGRVRIGTLDYYAASRYCPSVDALFESVAAIYGKHALAIILSGMGNDGVIGARSLAQSGAKILAQDSASSVIWGMPGSVVREGLASAVLPPQKIGQFISKNSAK
jgi:two-component system, chemotaxis family, protein-glutamate methylesterase/glutaminase